MTRLALLVLGLVALGARAANLRVVLLEAHGEPSDVEALRGSFEEWLKPLQLELQVVTDLNDPALLPSFAKVRVAWSDTDCHVEVFRGTGERTRDKVLPRGGAPLLVTESAALIAQAGVQELSIEEARRQPLPPPLLAVDPPVEVVPPAPARFSLGLAAWLQGRSYNQQAPVLLGGGAGVFASLHLGAWEPTLALLLNYQGPVQSARAASTLGVSVQMQAVGLRLLGGVRRELGVVHLEALGGGGLDLQVAQTTGPDSVSAQLKSPLLPAPFWTAGLGVHVRLTTTSVLFARALVDFDPAPRQYVTVVGTETTHLLDPWPVRPTLQLGFSFDVLGGGEP